MQDASERRLPWAHLAAPILAIMAAANLQYTWTLFVHPLMEGMGAKLSTVQLGFTIYIMAQTWLAPAEGWLADRFRPRPVAAIGALLVGANWIGAGLASTPLMLYAACLVGGFGCGLVMAAGARIAIHCFPGRRGSAMGLVSMAYGLGPVLAVVPIQATIERAGYKNAFLIWGVIQALIALGAAAFLREPPAPRPEAASVKRGLTPLQVLARGEFWLMYAIMTLVAVGGLTLTAQLAAIAAAFGFAKTTLAFGTGAVTLAIFLDRVTNAAARPLWGSLSDRLGRSETMAAAFVCEAAAIFLLLHTAGRPAAFVILSGAAFLAWGEIFSLFPATIADAFGAEHAMANYGLLFTAKGTASIFAGWGAAKLSELKIPWTEVLQVPLYFDLLAAAAAFWLLRPALKKLKENAT